MKKIDICLSPDLIHQFDLSGTVVVVIDILRATSSITTAIAHGVEVVRIVGSLPECRELKLKGYIGAAERGGKKVGGFDMGNSPVSFMNPELEDQKIAMTTTNGTVALKKASGALQVVIGSFLNYSALLSYLERLPCDLLLFCAGWKGKANLEDTLFAGAVIHGLKQMFENNSDVPIMAAKLYRQAKDSLKVAIEESSHVERLIGLGLEKDIDFCLKRDEYKVIPVLKGDYITKMKLSDMLF
jgi:2-phosphosulfolactate phosphatase